MKMCLFGGDMQTGHAQIVNTQSDQDPWCPFSPFILKVMLTSTKDQGPVVQS